MRQYSTIEEVALDSSWVTIGSFDGVHLGHQQLLQGMINTAHQAGGSAVVITFFPHPAAVLRGLTEPFYLTSPEERAALISNQGADVLISLQFTRELADRSAYDFVFGLKHHLGMQSLWAGFNFTLGRNREGDIPTLKRLGDVLGYQVEIVPPIELEGEVVSSSQVRRLLSKGDVVAAGEMLGRPYSLSGEVVSGDQRGRTIGFPTANLDYWPERLIPAAGVYAAWAWAGNLRHPSVVNIGIRPTFTPGETVQHVEAHLLDFHQDIYGRNLRLDFTARLRDEQRFDSIDGLISQIHADIQQARGLLVPS